MGAQDQVVVALLGWLDFCKEQDLDFENTVIQHMEDAFGEKFCRKRIDSRLRKLWYAHSDRLFGRASTRKVQPGEQKQPSFWKYMQINGSATYSDLPVALRTEIIEKVAEYRKKSVGNRRSREISDIDDTVNGGNQPHSELNKGQVSPKRPFWFQDTVLIHS